MVKKMNDELALVLSGHGGGQAIIPRFVLTLGAAAQLREKCLRAGRFRATCARGREVRYPLAVHGGRRGVLNVGVLWGLSAEGEESLKEEEPPRFRAAGWIAVFTSRSGRSFRLPADYAPLREIFAMRGDEKIEAILA